MLLQVTSSNSLTTYYNRYVRCQVSLVKAKKHRDLLVLVNSQKPQLWYFSVLLAESFEFCCCSIEFFNNYCVICCCAVMQMRFAATTASMHQAAKCVLWHRSHSVLAMPRAGNAPCCVFGCRFLLFLYNVYRSCSCFFQWKLILKTTTCKLTSLQTCPQFVVSLSSSSPERVKKM